MKMGQKMSIETRLRMSESQKRRLAGLPKRVQRLLSTADRDAIRKALKSGLRVLEVQRISVAPELGEDAKTKLTAALGLLGEG